MSRTVDKAVVEETRQAWIGIGCAICGEPVFELHHLRKRSAGGGDHSGNLIALCGEFQKNAHHKAVEDGQIEIYPTQNGGLAWQDRRTGESGTCLTPGASVSTLVSATPAESAPLAASSAGVPEVPRPGVSVSTPHVTGSSPVGETPANRFAFLQKVSKNAAQAYLVIAANLREVEESGEWRGLGFDAYRDYWGENGLGLPSGTVSKMRKVATFYQDAWLEVIETGASYEKLYHAARVATDPREAIGLAESMPWFELRALAKGAPPPEDEPRCEVCGQRLPPSYEARKAASTRVDL